MRVLFPLLLIFLLQPAVVLAASAERPFALTEQREPCAEYHPLRAPYFGDTHVHTKYSLDASTQGTRTAPADAYAFARGERIGVQPWTAAGEPLRSLQLERPLDFAVVTDHAELLGEVSTCNSPEAEGYGAWQCRLYRAWPRTAFFLFNTQSSRAKRLGFCGDNGELCRQAGRGPWQEAQQAAEAAYDRSANCDFTAFVGYEWTGASDNLANLHRNIIFRNERVPELPVSFIDTPSAPQLWDALDKQCVNAGNGCEVLVIPHNSNLSDGFMFQTVGDDGEAIDAADAAQRQRLERLVEVMQHKGSSECYYGPGNTEDELCAFEQLPYDKFSGKFMSLTRSAPKADDGFLRAVLRDGLAQEQKLGVNPFKVGFIGSTDTHISAAGAAEEGSFLGHGGAGEPAGSGVPKGLPDDLEFNPGGLAVVWAEQNSRDALFAAMQRRETYGTSGPRMTVRFFGGWDYPEAMCNSADFAAQGYRGGVPMGGDLSPAPEGGAPQFAVAAMMDPGTQRNPGTALQRVQIIKGWIDGDGRQRERVFEVAGNPDNGASVDLQSCQPKGKGFRELCTVWRDPQFNPAESAYYYARVVENPTCRWSQRICAASGVDCSKPETISDGLEACCAVEHRPSIQERAWTSPIWYRPPAAEGGGK